MLKNVSILNTQAVKILFSLSIALFAMAMLIFSASAQQLSVSEHEAVAASSSQDATIVASNMPTGTITLPLVPTVHFALIIQLSDVGTASLPPGTVVVPAESNYFYFPIQLKQ